MRKFLATGCTAVALIMGFGFEGGLTPYTLSILSHVPYYSTITSHIEEDWAIPDGDIKQQIEELAFCESSNQADVVIVDTNGYYSYGVLQFQYPTFQQYIRRYDLLPNVEEAELKNWILDADLQKYLAYRMISEDQKNWYHWRNCAKVIQAV
uniref:Transglycosylase SLT domain-containing protein n=1 Tax=viral metagenome TaxID=1070528 RepID=A0A6M3J6D7_9ZZZZ